MLKRIKNLLDWLFPRQYICGICAKDFRFQVTLNAHLEIEHKSFKQAPDGTVLNWGHKVK